MAEKEVTSVLISQNLFQLLPEEEKTKFWKYKEYSPEFIDKWSTFPDEDDYRNFEDEIFFSIEQYEDYWGDDWNKVRGVIYRKDYLGLGDDERDYFQGLGIDTEYEDQIEFHLDLEGTRELH